MRKSITILSLMILLLLTACGSPLASPNSSPTANVTAELTAPVPLDTAAAESDSGSVQPVQFAPVDEAVTATAGQAEAADLEARLIELYERANPAVVYIIAAPIGSGSGFVYSDDDYIITNNHVITGASSLEIVFANGERRSGRVVGADVDSDLAVLQVDSLPAGIEPLALGDTAGLKVGQFVVAIGNPFGEQGSMSLGIVSGLGRSLQSQRGHGGSSTYSLPEVIQTDAPINPGNSGGPLLSLDGEVLGINAAIASTTGTGSGVGFAIPVDAIRRIVPSLISDGSYSYPYMGAGFDDEVNLREQALYNLSQFEGAYVLNVTPGSPAAAAGLRAAEANTGRGGDLIIAIDGQPITNFADLNSYLVFHTTVGQTIELTLVRDGQTITLPLTLGERP
jgi:S1-C subfamily serine protease